MITTISHWAVLVIGICIGGGAGYLYARAEVWWVKKKMGWRLLRGGLKPIAWMVGAIVVLTCVGLAALGMLAI